MLLGSETSPPCGSDFETILFNKKLITSYNILSFLLISRKGDGNKSSQCLNTKLIFKLDSVFSFNPSMKIIMKFSQFYFLHMYQIIIIFIIVYNSPYLLLLKSIRPLLEISFFSSLTLNN